MLGCPASAGPLDLPKDAYSVQVQSLPSPPGRIKYLVKLPSPLKSPFAANNTIWIYLSLPEHGDRLPCILVLPVMAAPNLWIETQFIRRFEKDGFAVAWLEMPYQFHRRPAPLEPSGQVFLARTPKRLALNFRQAVLDARRVLQWLSRQPRIAPDRIGLFGISLGSLVGSSAYSVDSTPKYAVFLLGGADFPSLLAGSSMTERFIQKFGVSEQTLREAWTGLDPLDYRKTNAAKPVLLMNAEWDHVIPKDNALKLHEAFPASRQEWVPFGHYSAMIHLIWLPGYVSKIFQENL